MKLPIKSIFAGAQGLEEYDLHDADGVFLGTIYEWQDAVRIVHAVNNGPKPEDSLPATEERSA